MPLTIRIRSIILAAFIGGVIIEIYQNSISSVVAGFASRSSGIFGSQSLFILHIGMTIVFALALEHLRRRPVAQESAQPQEIRDSIYRTGG